MSHWPERSKHFSQIYLMDSEMIAVSIFEQICRSNNAQKISCCDRFAIQPKLSIHVLLKSALHLAVPSTKLPLGANNAVMDLLLQWDAIYTAADLMCSMLEKYPRLSPGLCLALLLQCEQHVYNKQRSCDSSNRRSICSLQFCTL